MSKLCCMCKTETIEFKYSNKNYCPDCLLKELNLNHPSVELLTDDIYLTNGHFVGDINVNSSSEIVENIMEYIDIQILNN